ADRRAEDERAIADRRRKEQRERLRRAEELLLRAEDEAAQREPNWLEELVEARLKVMDLREELKAKERDLKDRWVATDPMADVLLRTLLDDRNRAAKLLDEVKAAVAKEDDPVAQRLTREAKALEEKVEKRQQVLKQEAADRIRQRDEGFAKLRGL